MENSFLGQALATLLILIHISTHTASISSTKTFPTQTNTDYIKTSCNATIYPKLCYHSLSIYATKIKTDPKILARTALNVTLFATKSTSRMVNKMSKIHGLNPREANAMLDCVEVISDSVDEIRRSIEEMDHIRNSNFGLTMSDIETWVSAALTDEDTCMDGFEGKDVNLKLKNLVRRHIVKVAHLTSNALALVNRYASTQLVPP